VSVFESQVPHEAQDEAEDRENDDPQVAAVAVLRSLLGGLLVDLGDQAVHHAVVSDVVILECAGVVP
jgi:hypothetical protein